MLTFRSTSGRPTSGRPTTDRPTTDRHDTASRVRGAAATRVVAAALTVASGAAVLVLTTTATATATPAARPAAPTHAASAAETRAMQSTDPDVLARTARAQALPQVRGARSAEPQQADGPSVRIDGTAPAGTGRVAARAAAVGATGTAPTWPGAYNANPNRQIGKLMFFNPGTGQNSWCTATAVTSGNKSTIVTAGHCVYNPDPDNNGVVSGNGYWMTKFVFCPGFESGCTLGSWTYRRASTTPTWFAGYGSNHTYDFRDDVAVVLLNRDASGRYLTDVVGSQGIWFNGPTNVTRTSFGYPATDWRFPGVTYSGNDLTYCQNTDTVDSTYSGALWIPCTMTGGASGGPWLTWVQSGWSGYINSVNSHKPYGLGYMDGPYFDTAEQTLYNTWKTQ